MRAQQAAVDYKRIESAIHFIREHQTDQPTLEEIASYVNMSPYHFQKLFRRWAGISPKKFLQYLTIQYAKEQMKETLPLTEIAYNAGLSGTGRLHDLFTGLEGMTPGQYRKSGSGITIHYGFHPGPFGNFLLAMSSEEHICALEFTEDRESAVRALKQKWSRSTLIHDPSFTGDVAARIFVTGDGDPMKLLVQGTPFQLKVWEALLKIPFGELVSYQAVSMHINSPGGLQATGGAIGRNPVAWLIPCHRVIRKTGDINGYRWGLERKAALIGWEAARHSLL